MVLDRLCIGERAEDMGGDLGLRACLDGWWYDASRGSLGSGSAAGMSMRWSGH